MSFAADSGQWHLAVAVAIGLLMGAERERHKGVGPQRAPAGVRTFALIALLGGVSARFGEAAVLVGAGAFVGALVIVGYARNRSDDPGVTTEVAAVLAFLLGAMSDGEPGLAAAVAVGATIVLWARHPLHHFVRDIISDDELRDGLTLVAAAVVVLPLMPNEDLGPGGTLNPFTLWRLAVLVLAVGAVGHVGVRLVGPRYGLALAALASALASGVATIGAMASRARREPKLLAAASAGAIISNAATAILTLLIVATASPGLLATAAWPVALAGLVAVGLGVGAVRRAPPAARDPDERGRMFDLRAAAALVVTIAIVLAASAFLSDRLGATGLILSAAVAGFADSQAAAISAAAIYSTGGASAVEATLAILAGLTTNTVTKALVARVAGGGTFLRRTAPALAAFAVTPWIALATARALGMP